MKIKNCMVTRKLLVLFFLSSLSISFFSKSYGQGQTDSLIAIIELGVQDENTVKAYAKLCSKYSSIDSAKAIKYGVLGFQLSKKIGSYKGVYICLKNIANVYASHDNNIDAIKILHRLLSISIEYGSKREIASVYYNLSYLNLRNGNLALALDYSQRAIRIYEILEDKRSIAFCYNIIGSTYVYKNSSLALEYYKKSLITGKKIGDIEIITTALANIGHLHLNNDNLSLALKYYKKALVIGEEDINLRSLCYENIAWIYLEQKKYDLAIEYFEKVYIIETRRKNKYALISILRSLAFLDMNLGNYSQATNWALKSLSYSEEINSLEYIAQNSMILAACYDSLKDFKNAYHYQKYYATINDSIYNAESSKQINEMEAKYQAEKKEKEILGLQKEREIKELEANRQKDLKVLFMSSGMIFLLTSIVLFYLFYQRRRLNKVLSIANNKLTQSEKALLELNSTKDKFFAIISHDIRNPLSAFRATTRLLVNSFSTLSENEKFLKINEMYKSSENLYQLFQNLLQWAVSQNQITSYSPKEIDLSIIVLKAIMITRLEATKKDISIINEIYENTIVFADVNMVSTVFLNLITNAVKFSKPGRKIYVFSEESEKYITVSIKDEGIGISSDDINKLFKIEFDHKTIGYSGEKGTGLGLILCKEFIEKNGGKIWVKSELGRGSVFSLSLPKSFNT